MKKNAFLLVALFLFQLCHSQKGYEIVINLKNFPDNQAFLTYYQFDKTFIKDTSNVIKEGKIIFSGKGKLEKGIYSLVSQQKTLLFDFYVDDNTQKLEFSSDYGEKMIDNLTAKNHPTQQEFFNYLKLIKNNGTQFEAYKKTLIGLPKNDSISKLLVKQKELDKSIKTAESKLYESSKGSYLHEVINLKLERILEEHEIPKASNGRPDSTVVYQYYRKNYWKEVNFKDDAILRNPFFFKKIKRYFDQVIPIIPDTISVEVDRILAKTEPESKVYKFVLSYLTYNYEVSKIVGLDEVFVHIADTYFKTGRANNVYDDTTIPGKIIKKAERLRPLLIGAKAPELKLIKAEDAPTIRTMGFDAATTSEEVTSLYYKNLTQIEKLFFNLNSIQAEYLIIAFWDVDCGHCQKEIPKLLEVYHELKKEQKDVKVLSVYTQHDSPKYLKYIEEHQLDFINTYDGVHFNNIMERYDVYTTPVIYILDKNKIIKGKKIGVEQIKEYLRLLDTEKVK